MVSYDPKQWLRITFSLRGTVLPRVLGRMVFLSLLALALWGFQEVTMRYQGPGLPAIDPLGHVLMGVAVGLLIVFRNNASYDRYWEGRKQWGGIVNSSRNLVRGAAAFVGPAARDLVGLVAAYALALKQHLRSNRDLAEIEPLVPKEVFAQASASANPPLAVAYHLSRWIHDRVAAGQIDTVTARPLEAAVSALLDHQGACERILKTPIPFAYAVHIKQLLMLYLVTLPLVLVPKMNWGAVLAVGVISFGLLGIEEAGVEIEDPFGDDPNDLPVEAICAVIARDTAAVADMAGK